MIFYFYNRIYHLILFIIASLYLVLLRSTCSNLDAVQGDLMLQVCFPVHSDVGSSGPYDPCPGATSCTSHRTRERICRSSNSDIIPQCQPVSYHQSYFSPSTQDAEPVSPLVDIPPLSQANTPPNLQVPSPPVCSTGSQDANSALPSCTMRDWHTHHV